MDIQIPSFTDVLNQHLKDLISSDLQVDKIRQIGGGSINTAMLIHTNQGKFFAKYNDASKHAGMFGLEAQNLQLLLDAKALNVPKVYGTMAFEEKEFLVLQYIEPGNPHYDFWRDLGIGLARQHKESAEKYGLGYDNYMGTLLQRNRQMDDWVEFFISCRLEPMLKMAFDDGKADQELIKQFEALYLKLPEIFPEEKPALLHGDLWSGNCMADENGDPYIYDPAVYYGHREMDIGMTRLFGGFEMEFYEAYNEEFPMEKHWEQRVAICNLYPLLVHVNLFVGSYIQSVKNIISRY